MLDNMTEGLQPLPPGMDPASSPEEAAEAGPPPEMTDPDYETVPNLVPKLPEWFLKAVGERVVSDKKIDWKSQEGYRAKRDRQFRLFAADIPGKPEGQENLVIVHLPLITKAVLQMHSHLHPAFFPQEGEFCGVRANVPSELQRTRRMSRHMNIQLRQEITEYVPANDRGGIQILIYGSAFDVWWYDPVLRRPRYEMITSDDLILPYACMSDQPDLSDVPRKTWRKRYYRHELEALQDVGYYTNVDKLFPEPYGKDGAPTGEQSGQPTPEKDTVRETANDLMGTTPNKDDQDAPREILEQDRWLVLPGEKRQRPVTICVDEPTNTVLRLAPCERDDLKDKKRFDRDQVAYQSHVDSMQMMHEQAMQEHAAALADHQQASQYTQDFGVPPDGMVEPLPPHPGEPPPPPPQLPPPDPPRKVPWHRYTHYICFPNPEGIYGLGVGYLVEGHNLLVDEILTRHVSLLAMHCLPTYIYSRQSRVGRGELKLKLGEGNEVLLPPEQVNAGAGIHQFQFPPPPADTHKIVEQQSQAAQDITANDIIAGAPGLSGQTAAETEMRSSNAMQNLTTIGARFNRSRDCSLRNLAYINSQTLDESIFYVPGTDDPKSEEDYEEYRVTREDYVEDYTITFTSDPNLASQPQREKAAMKIMEVLTQLVQQAPGGVPVLDPPTAIALLRAGAAQALDAMERHDIAQQLAAAPLPQLQQPGPPGGPPPPGGEENGNGPPAPNGAGRMEAAPDDGMGAPPDENLA